MKQVTENPAKNRPIPALTIIVALLITCYLTANVMAVKLINIHGVTIFDAGTIIFPFAYMLSDVLTEVWGFKTAKQVIWLTFVCEIIFTLFTWIGIQLPSPEGLEKTAESYAEVFGVVPRITIASLIAFLIGELINAWTFVKIKEATHGKRFWLRAIGSSLFGYILDTSIFVIIAFTGTVPAQDIISMIVIQVIAKLLIESTLATPIAWLTVKKIKPLVNGFDPIETQE